MIEKIRIEQDWESLNPFLFHQYDVVFSLESPRHILFRFFAIIKVLAFDTTARFYYFKTIFTKRIVFFILM